MSLQAAAVETWQEANKRHLVAALAGVKNALERHAAGEPTPILTGALPEAAGAISPPPALDRLCAAFSLTPFERDVLLLCAGIELESGFGSLCAAAQGDPQRGQPTFSLALAALPDAHWSALSPSAPLRYWRLIEVGAGSTLTLSPLRIDERVLHYLAGVQHMDERLAGIVESVTPAEALLSRSQRQVAALVAAVWRRGRSSGLISCIQLCGPESGSKRAVAAAACAASGLNLAAIAASSLPTTPHELDGLIRLWLREAALEGCALLLECDGLDFADAARSEAVRRVIEQVHSALIISSRERRPDEPRGLVTFEVGRPASNEQADMWRQALAETACAPGTIEALVSQFSLGAPAINAICAQALDPDKSTADIPKRLWDGCRSQARPRMEGLARRIEPSATWDDLVLPEAQLRTLREVAVHVRQRARVYEQWGFAARYARGLGICLLAAGPSGTGKTMAAEVLANDLQLDLYHIDLSQVVSKYIGETEKNLSRLFDGAESGAGILLFDEADALFGRRTEVKDSHDRYANIEISYLLQRVEAYRGLAILTTNMKDALDAAFLRRIRFVVQFPFPDVALRTQIWRRIFPGPTPTQDLDIDRLARLNLSGGNIRNVAMGAAFLAAEAGAAVGMRHLAVAARSEYAKLEKPLSEVEIGGWV